MSGTFSNPGSPEPVSLDSIQETMAKLAAMPRLPGVIYVREDVWPEFEKRCAEMLAAVDSPQSVRSTLEELLAINAGFPGYSIRIEVRKYLPKPWMTDIEFERIEALLRAEGGA